MAFNQAPLRLTLEGFFPTLIRGRGRTCFIDGCIEKVSLQRGGLQAVVTDSKIYGTQMKWELGNRQQTVSVHCSCPEFAAEGPCKHLWATLLAVEAEGLVTGSVKPGHVPPFSAEPSQPLILDDDWDADWGDPEGFGPRSGKRRALPAPQVEEQLPVWVLKLQEVGNAMQTGGGELLKYSQAVEPDGSACVSFAGLAFYGK